MAGQRRIAIQGIAPAAAAAGAHDRLGVERHRDVGAHHGLEIVLAGQPQQIAAGLAGRAAPQAPRRAIQPPGLLEIPAALDQVAHLHVEPEPAAMPAGAAGILAQAAALDQHRAFELDAFDRAVAHVALAHRHGGRLAVLGRPAAPAAAFDALDDETALALGMHAEEHHGAAEEAVMPGRHPVAHGLRQRLDDGVDHHRHDDAPARHRRRKPRHHDAAFRDDYLERAKRAFVDGIERAGQRLIGDAGAGERARVDSSPPLLGAARQVDHHRALLDRDLDPDRDRLALEHAVVVHGGLRLVDAVWKLRHDIAALGLGLVEDAVDGGQDGALAVFVEQLVHAARREAAGGHLRLHVAERGFRKADVVLEHAVERLVDLALAVDLELIELQALEPGIGHLRAGAEAGRGAADVDPVRPHHGEHQELALVEIGHVDDDVVEMLAGDRLMIGDDHVARLETVAPVALHPVHDDDAEIGDEMRDAADILRDQLALGVDERGAEVAHLVDHHVVGGALQVGRHLVGDRRQGVADDLEGDRVERLAVDRLAGASLARLGFAGAGLTGRGLAHWRLAGFGHHAPPILMISSPDGVTRQSSLLNSTVVVPCSWMSAGPTTRAPALRASR